MTPLRVDPHRAGIGLRLPHLAEMVATRPPVGWLEIHPDNFLANPHATELLVTSRVTIRSRFTRSAFRSEVRAASTGAI
jgi:hypothetical protein